jgi:hypothetical protein
MDLEEYNHAYALWLREEGWQAEEGELPDDTGITQKPKKAKVKGDLQKRAKLHDIVDLTSTACIAGKHIKAMNATAKNAVVDKLAKTSKRNENKTIKGAVLAVTYEATCKAALSLSFVLLGV